MAVALAASIAACGGGGSSDADEATGTFKAQVVTAAFPTAQRLGQTSLLRIGVRNSGKKTIPGLAVTISVGGKAGQASSLPFGTHDPTPGLAQPDRPVWVLAAGYPKLAGSSSPGGAGTSNSKTFSFGPLKAGATTNAVWKLSAVKSGEYTLLYGVGAGFSGSAKVETDAGVKPGGSFAIKVSSEPPNSEVTDSGEVVEVK